MAREFYGPGEIISSGNPTTSNILHHHHQHQMINQIQGYEETNPSDHYHHHHHHHQIFSLSTNMGMIDFSKQHHHHHHHQISMTNGLEETTGGENLLLEDSSSSMRCVGGNVFPCEVNERPSQGLSLSLSSSNPTTISLQSFELRPQTHHQDHHHVLATRVVGSARQGYFGKSNDQNVQHTQMLMMMNNHNTNYLHHHHHHDHDQFHIRRSRYLAPAQELLNEFCSLAKQSDEEIIMMKQKSQKGKQHQLDSNTDSSTDHDLSASTSRKHVPPLHSLEFMELKKRKTKLLAMLEELDKRYRQYCEQMRETVAAFEATAGVGAAAVYTASAARAMSRHFRCLRDGLVGQIQATRKAMGEKDPVTPGTTRGETPRLRMLDQAFRQHKAYQQMSFMEAHPWRPQRGLPERAVSILRAWLFEHFLHPYPSDVDKHILARQTGLSRSQVSNWFINARVRLWKPMIEEMYLEEGRQEPGHNNNNNNNTNNASSSSDHHQRVSDDNAMVNPMIVDAKPEPNQLIRIDPDSLSSIVTNPSSKNDPKTSKPFMSIHHYNQGTTSFGSTFDFPSYGPQAVTYAGDSGFNRGTGGVSLTLGLQQHGGNGGVSLALSTAAGAAGQGGPLFYGRDHMEDCQQGVHQYASMLDGDQAQNLPYRNLMGAQLLHDMV